MTLRLPLSNEKKFATLVSAYGPTMTNPDEVKDKFYEDLNTVIGATPNSDKLIILGDSNARVGCDSAAWKSVIGKHGVGKCNSIGLLLIQTCSEHDLLITNTVFRLPIRNRMPWMHPRSKYWHLIDYLIIRKGTGGTYVLLSCAGHRLIVAKLNLHIQPREKTPRKESSITSECQQAENRNCPEIFL